MVRVAGLRGQVARRIDDDQARMGSRPSSSWSRINNSVSELTAEQQENWE